MKVIARVSLVVMIALALAVPACTGGGNDMESKYAKIFSDLNKDWKFYEVVKKGTFTTIKVEVSENVPLKEAQKALAKIQELGPKLEGYIEFYNSEVGMVLRKVEIIPNTPST